MKKQFFVLAMAITLVAFGVAYAQTTPQSTLPPSQQVDQSGHPETGPGPDVDVDTGKNASNGVLDVDVSRTTDPDTAANNGQPATTGTGLKSETEPAGGPDVDVDTGSRAAGAVDVDVKAHGDSDTSASGVDETGRMDHDVNTTAGDRSLPGTASEMPAVALLGLLALAAAFTVRFLRS